MGKFINALGEQAGGIVGTAMGMALSGWNDRRQVKQQEKLTKVQSDAQYDLWQKTNYPAQVEQLKQAGLNPALLYGMGGAGGATTGSIGGGQAPAGGGEIMGMQMMQAQLDVMKSQAELNRAKASETPTKIDNTKQQTANLILEGIIKEYTGKEAKDTYERITSPNRSIQAKTYQDELEARQGTAGTIYELWAEGKLKDKSVAEIESIVLGNAKSRAEKSKILKEMDLLEENLKGKKLENIITELETKLQTETGIDRNSPYWLRTLGRLFLSLMGGD